MVKKNIAIIGDGAWGTAIALLLNRNGHNVSVWGHSSEYVDEIQHKRVNEKFLPGVFLPLEIEFLSDLEKCISRAEIIVSAVPSQFTREVLRKIAKFDYKGKIFVNVAKGIENDSLKRMSEVFSDELREDFSYCVLSGPSHAEEVAIGCPTAVVVAAKKEETAKLVQNVFMNDYFRIYTSNDVVGVELGGSLKNIYAIAAGVVDGMKLGDNAKAALITRGIAELAKLGVALGGDPRTFSGLSGIGDLIVTCTSRHSRNRYVGEELGKGKSMVEILKSLGQVVAEGVPTSKSAYQLAKKLQIDTPIINEVYAGLYERKDPRQCVTDLMTRTAKSEF